MNSFHGGAATLAAPDGVGVSVPTRDTVLDLAAARLAETGWASLGFRDLARRIGISAAAIHHHFPTKADLGIALVTRLRDERAARELGLVLAYPDHRERLLALGRQIEELACQAGTACPIQALQADYAALPDALQNLVTGWIDDCLDGLAGWLQDGRAAGTLRFPGPARLQALVVWSVLQQAGQLRRTHPRIDHASLIRQLVDSLSPSAPSQDISP